MMARRRARERLAARMTGAREEERRRIARQVTEEPLRTMRSVRARLEELDVELRSPRTTDWEALRRDVDEVCRTLERLLTGLATFPAP
jgi:signal transduction histidine kinase